MSEGLNDLLNTALDHACNSISEGGPLVPFLLAEVDGKRKIERFVVGEDDAIDLAASVEAGRKAAKGLRRHTYSGVLAYDGRITLEGKKTDCLIFEVCETGAPYRAMFGQPYIEEAEGGPCTPVGDPLHLGDETPGW